LSVLAVKQRVEKDVKDTSVTEVIVRSNKLSMYDNLLKEEVCCG